MAEQGVHWFTVLWLPNELLQIRINSGGNLARVDIGNPQIHHGKCVGPAPADKGENANGCKKDENCDKVPKPSFFFRDNITIDYDGKDEAY